MSKADLNKKPADVAAMFDQVAPTYDVANTLLSLGQDRLWRRAVLKRVAPQADQAILDLAAGTGASSVVFAKPGVRVVAADFSKGMLEEGRRRHPNLEFVFADATALPFGDNEFDAVTMSFGLRNVVDVPKALSELFRVTKPGGRIVICEFSRVTLPVFRGVYNFYLGRLLPLIARLASKTPEAYLYLAESIAAWPNQHELLNMIETAGFKRAYFKNLTAGIVALHVGFKPEEGAKA